MIQRILKIRRERERKKEGKINPRRNFPRHGFTEDRASIKWSKELRDCEVKNDEIYVKLKFIENRGEI